jgi:hypothetical protein
MFTHSDLSNFGSLQRASEVGRTPHAKASPTNPTAQVDWKLVRTPGRPQDQTVSESTITWARQLGQEVMPVELLKRYPRVANRLALCWSDPVLTARLLDTLLMDRRGGRQGFPGPVAAELARMRRLYKEAPVDAALSGPWSLQATSDR